MYPPAAFLTKVCTNPFKLESDGARDYVVQRGTAVIIPLSAIHHDAQHFPEPDRFDPERFNADNKKHIRKGTYFPFGDGPRMCLGKDQIPM